MVRISGYLKRWPQTRLWVKDFAFTKIAFGSVVQEYAANMSRKKVKEDKMKAPSCAASVNFGIDPLPGTQAVPWRDRGRQRNSNGWCMEGLEVLIHGDVKLQTIDFGQGENEKMEQTIQQTAAALDGLNQFVLIAGKQLGRTDLFLKHFGSQNLSLKGIAQMSLGMPIDQPFQMSQRPLKNWPLRLSGPTTGSHAHGLYGRVVVWSDHGWLK